MIRMINGSTRIGANIYTSANGAFAATPEIEKRLVDNGAAVYVTGVATAQDGQENNGASDNPPNDESLLNGAEGAVVSSFGYTDIPEYNTSMTVNQLRDVAKKAGVKFKVGMTKEDMVAELDRFFGLDESNDEEDAPDLTAEDPIE